MIRLVENIFNQVLLRLLFSLLVDNYNLIRWFIWILDFDSNSRFMESQHCNADKNVISLIVSDIVYQV